GGNFQLKTVSVPNGARAVAAGVFNGDGKADIAAAGASSATVSILLGRGDGTFGPAKVAGVVGLPTWLRVADFNRDGKADLAVGNATTAQVSVLLGKGDDTFQANRTVAVANGA